MHHFLNQSEAILKPIMTCSNAFSHTRRRLHVYFWIIILFASAVIGQSDYLGVGFMTLDNRLKTALSLKNE